MSLRRSAFSAGRWTSASTLFASGLQVLQTVILARILAPGDFGLMAVAAVIVGVLTLVVDLGFTQALIHFDEVPKHHRSTLFWLNMGIACGLMLTLVALGPVFRIWFESPALAEVLHWTAVVFPITAAGQQLRALAARDLRFDLLAVNAVVAALGGLLSAVAGALLGFGVYALVIGLLVNAAMDSLLAWLRLPRTFRPGWHCQPREARPYLCFGGYLVGESLLSALRRNVDVLIGGLVVGPGPVGLYSVPRDLSLRGASVLNSIVTKVGFPVMARVKEDPARLRHIYLQTLRMTASINFPLYIALGIFASEVVNLLYGPQWHDAIPFLSILAAWGLVRSTGNPVGSLIYASGQTKRAFWWNMALLFVFPPVLWLGAHLGQLLGLSIAILSLQLVVMLPAWYFVVRPCCGAHLAEYLNQFVPPLLCAFAAGVAAWFVVHDLPHGTLRLGLGCIIGGMVYLGFSWFLNRRWVLAMLELLRVRHAPAGK